MPVTTLITDTECFPNLWCIGFKRVADGKVLVLEKSTRSDLDYERLEKLIRMCRIVTFNGRGYDMPMIWAAIRGWSIERLKKLNDAIIMGRVPWWRVEDDLLGFKIPRTDYIDLMETQPNAIASLKTLNGRLQGHRMQDLPYHPDDVLIEPQMDHVIGYMGNDLDATHLLFDALKEPLELREALGREYRLDFRSKSDSQCGETILRRRVEQITGEYPVRAETKPGSKFPYHVPEYVNFRHPALCAMLERLRGAEFVVQGNGKVAGPDWLKGHKIVIGSTTYSMGIGGLHSTEAARSVVAGPDEALLDFDVSSFYPAIILESGLYPKAFGPAFLDVYRKVRDERLVAKQKGLKSDAEGLKIALNGSFGKLGSPYSVLYAPHLMIAITLTGQLAALMLIDRAEAAGISAVSGNTDGMVFLCPRNREADLNAIAAQWEADTGFGLEVTRYRSLHSASVNTYFAIKEDGKVKRKGLYANPWNDGAAIREQLMKNPNMTVCSDAALAFIQHGTPVEDTIRSCADIRQFVTVVNVRGGGTWRGEYLGKVVRFYWAEGGAPILYKTPHPTTGNFKQVSNTAGSRPMMQLVDKFPVDLDYARYIRDANDILVDVGAMQPANDDRPLLALMMAAVA